MKNSIKLIAGLLAITLLSVQLHAEKQDRESMAMDSTATQWSFQFAYQSMPNYYDDLMDNGDEREAGLDNYVQVRIVAPIPLEDFTILPRLTLRHYENPQGDSGIGNTELFGLIIPKSWDWGNGRMGIGPLVTLPGNDKVAKDEWGYGFAAAAVNNSGPFFYGLLFTQSWHSINPNTLATSASTSNTNPLGIAPFLAYRMGAGWYVQNADMVALYDWKSGSFYMPVGVRLGKVFVQESSSWNVYTEYLTSMIYKEWEGPAVKDSIRFNISYTIPVGLK